MIDNKRSNTLNCIPSGYDSSSKIKLVHILNVKAEHICHLVAMKDRLDREFTAYKAIFNVESIIIIDYELAKNELNFFIV
jgi:hypothetical protein